MSAMFKWPARRKTPPRQIGDVRQVRRPLIFPRCIGGEWRWLGFETIEQIAYLGWSWAPDTKPYQTTKWRDSRWVK